MIHLTENGRQGDGLSCFYLQRHFTNNSVHQIQNRLSRLFHRSLLGRFNLYHTKGMPEDFSMMTALFRWQRRLRERVSMPSKAACSETIGVLRKGSCQPLKDAQDLPPFQERREPLKVPVTDWRLWITAVVCDCP